MILVALGQRGGETFFSNPWLALTGLIAAFSGVAAGVATLAAVIWRGERSILVFIALAGGLFVLFFVTGELTVPH